MSLSCLSICYFHDKTTIRWCFSCHVQRKHFIGELTSQRKHTAGRVDPNPSAKTRQQKSTPVCRCERFSTWRQTSAFTLLSSSRCTRWWAVLVTRYSSSLASPESCSDAITKCAQPVWIFLRIPAATEDRHPLEKISRLHFRRHNVTHIHTETVHARIISRCEQRALGSKRQTGKKLDWERKKEGWRVNWCTCLHEKRQLYPHRQRCKDANMLPPWKTLLISLFGTKSLQHLWSLAAKRDNIKLISVVCLYTSWTVSLLMRQLWLRRHTQPNEGAFISKSLINKKKQKTETVFEG